MITNYKLFTTPTCPGCPQVKEHMKAIKVTGENIDASTLEGAQQAGTYGIMSVPTVLFFDDRGRVVATAQSIKQVEKVLESESAD